MMNAAAVCRQYDREFKDVGYRPGQEYADKIKKCTLTSKDVTVLKRTLGYARQVVKLTGADGMTGPNGTVIPVVAIPHMLNAKLLKFWKNMHPELKSLLKLHIVAERKRAAKTAGTEFRRRDKVTLPRYTKAPMRVPRSTPRYTKAPPKTAVKKAPRRTAAAAIQALNNNQLFRDLTNW